MIMKYFRSVFADNLQEDGYVTYALENRNEEMQFGGRDGYHKVVLISGIGEVIYNHKVYKIEGVVLLITQPGFHCTWNLFSTTCSSYVCTFNDDFIKKSDLSWTKECNNYFSLNPVFTVESEEEKFIRSIFCTMTDEQTGTYQFKEELAQNKIRVLTLLALKMTPVKCEMTASRWYNPSTVSLELVELRFPEVAQILHFN
jgi:hypothetical protein